MHADQQQQQNVVFQSVSQYYTVISTIVHIPYFSLECAYVPNMYYTTVQYSKYHSHDKEYCTVAVQ